MAWPAVVAAIVAGGIKIGAAALGKQKAPGAVPLEQIDIGATSQEALDVNLANLDEIEQLISRSSEITDEAALASLDRLIPGFRNLQQRLIGFATERTEKPFELPREIIDQLARVSAERGFVSGVDVRSGVGSFDLLRNLGITSLEFGRQNIQDAASIFGQVREATPIFSPINPASFMFSPQNVTDLRAREADINQQILQSEETARVAAGNVNRAAMAKAVGSALGGISGQLAEAGFYGSPAPTTSANLNLSSRREARPFG